MTEPQGVSAATMLWLRYAAQEAEPRSAELAADCRAILAALEDAQVLGAKLQAMEYALDAACKQLEVALEDAAKWRAQRVVGRIVGMNVVADPTMPLDEIQFRMMVVCPVCGYKRCPGANGNPCTASNAPSQPGSNYEDAARAAED